MTLSGRTVVVLATPDYHELEFWYPVLRGREEDADVRVVASAAAGVESHLGYPVVPDTEPDALTAGDVDAVVVPGTVSGVPELSPKQWDLVRAVAAAGGVVGSVGSGAQLLRKEAPELLDGRNVSAGGTDELPEFFRSLIQAIQADQADQAIQADQTDQADQAIQADQTDQTGQAIQTDQTDQTDQTLSAARKGEAR